MVSSVRPEEDLLLSPGVAAAALGSALATETAFCEVPVLSDAFCYTVWVERTTLLSGS